MMFPKAGNVRLAGDLLRRLVMQIWDRDDGLCVVCGRWVEEGTKPHHEPPKSQGGQDREEDLFMLCDGCHYERHHGRKGQDIKSRVLEVRSRLYESTIQECDDPLPVAGQCDVGDAQTFVDRDPEWDELSDRGKEKAGRKGNACKGAGDCGGRGSDQRIDGVGAGVQSSQCREEVSPSSDRSGGEACGVQLVSQGNTGRSKTVGEDKRTRKEAGNARSDRPTKSRKKPGRKPSKWGASNAEIRARAKGGVG